LRLGFTCRPYFLAGLVSLANLVVGDDLPLTCLLGEMKIIAHQLAHHHFHPILSHQRKVLLGKMKIMAHHHFHLIIHIQE
jgi:hypothetical protein